MIIDEVHPLLSILLLDHSLPAKPPEMTSAWRRSLGVFSRATIEDGEQVWCEFRAGTGTHHIDFDQGNIRIAAWDRALLGDYSYHCHEPDGSSINVGATWVHNCVVYSDYKTKTAGYTGLEQAPEPALVHLADDFDWCVHRIVNTNLRAEDPDAPHFWLRMYPVPRTSHVRHYLFVKPDYVLIWDVFEEAHGPSTFWLHPTGQPQQIGDCVFRTGPDAEPHLHVEFLRPQAPEVIENTKLGPHWSLGVRNQTGRPYLVLLVPQKKDRGAGASYDDATRTASIAIDGRRDTIILPPPGTTDQLPQIQRGGPA